jgi:phage shock protein PspC (stress-responsive transcriptional regulator)
MPEDIDEIVRIMGAPRDLQGEEDEQPHTANASSTEQTSSTREEPDPGLHDERENDKSSDWKNAGEPLDSPYAGRKRFYRDPEDKWLGGVCSGFATYVGLDPLIVRLAFLLFLIAGGSGAVLYLVLWAIVPEAKTASDRLQAKGEKVTIDSIERSIRKEAKDLKKRFKDFSHKAEQYAKDAEKYADKAGKQAESVSDEIEREARDIANRAEKKGRDFFVETGDSFRRMFRGGTRMILVLIIGVLMLTIFASFAALAGTAGYVQLWLPGFTDHVFSTETQSTLAGLGLALVLAIPVVVTIYKAMKFILGIKGGTKGIDAAFMFAWVIGLGMVITVGTRVAMEFQREVSFREEVPLNTGNASTVYLNLSNGAEYAEYPFDSKSVGLVGDSLLFHRVDLDIRRAPDNRFSLETIRRARGLDRKQARLNARSIGFSYSQPVDSVLELSDWYQLHNSTWRDQELGLVFNVPVGKGVVIGENLHPMISRVETDGWLGHSELYNQPLIMSEGGLILEQ